MDDVVVDTEKMMQHYSRLSANKLTETTVRAFTQRVQDGVKLAQEKADLIVNSLTSRSRAPDFQAARRALSTLAKCDSNIASHWAPFIKEVAALLPPSTEGDLGEAEDEGAIQMRMTGLADLIDRLITPLPMMNGAELRDVAMLSERIESAIEKEFEKRGLKLGKANVDAVALAMLETQFRAALDNQPVGFSPHPLVAELVSVFTKMNENANAASVALAARDEKISALQKEEESLKSSLASERSMTEVNAKALGDAESQLAETKKRAGELEHELEALKKSISQENAGKKQSSKPR